MGALPVASAVASGLNTEAVNLHPRSLFEANAPIFGFIGMEQVWSRGGAAG
jgi:hypothetical protein